MVVNNFFWREGSPKKSIGGSKNLFFVIFLFLFQWVPNFYYGRICQKIQRLLYRGFFLHFSRTIFRAVPILI